MATLQTSCAEGIHELALNGDPATVEFALVTKPLAIDPANPLAGELDDVSVFADLTEASWAGSTPYARITRSMPAPVNGVWTFTNNLEWNTGTATTGQASVPTLAVLLPTATRKILGLWDLSYYLRDGLTQLNGGVTLPTGTLTVDSTTGFPSTGTLLVNETHLVTYTGKTATTFTGCSGGSGAVADNKLVRLPIDMSAANTVLRVTQPFVLFVQSLTVTP